MIEVVTKMAVIKQDVRIMRTLNLIRGAFLALLEEKGFENMTVQDILDRTQINRSTFYAHFKNKNDVVKMFIDEIKGLLYSNFETRFSIPTREFVQKMIPIFWQYKDMIRLIGRIETPRINLYSELQRITKQVYIQQAILKTGKSSEELDLQGHIFAVTTLGLMRYFIENNEISTPNKIIGDLEEVFNLLIIPE